MSDRRLKDWLSSYLDFTENSEPPTLFKKWVGVSAIASCLQRKCYMEWEDSIYPNMYIVIIGPSGCRKGTAMGPALRMLQDLGMPLAAEATTREALIQTLAKVTSSFTNPETNETDMHSSLTIFSAELTVFIGYDNKQLISDLTDWFDCRNRWTYRTKSSGTDDIWGVWVNLIGATTPEMLQNTLPRDAVGGGLTSRMVFVYGDKKSKIVPYPIINPEHAQLRKDLVADLEAIHALRGKFVATQGYIDAYIEWYLGHCETPVLEDINFRPYLERRPTHLRKLTMIMSASRSSELILTLEDFQNALKLLKETEAAMPNVFRGYGSLDDAELFPRLMAAIAKKKRCTIGDLMKLFYRDLTIDTMKERLEALRAIGYIKMTVGATTVLIEYIGEQGE